MSFIRNGPKENRPIRNPVYRDHYGAHDHLLVAFFSENPMYDAYKFGKTFQMARPLFHRIVDEYLRKPTVTDVVKLYQNHEEKHGRPGMLGDLDCTGSVYVVQILFVADVVTYPWEYYLVHEIYPKLVTLVKTIQESADDDYKRI
nr:hypothetical protein [Tanacetum cinerariifolium]